MPADEGRRRKNTIDEDSDSDSDQVAPVVVAPIPKKPKSSSKLKNFLFFIFLATGAIIGLHHSGYINILPFIWSTAPKIPYIGDYLKAHYKIPEVYTLTVEERRKLELQQWQDRLDIKERELQEKLAQSEILSNDITIRQQKIDKQEADLLIKGSDIRIKAEATPEEEALMKELTGTYQEISPRRSAQIVAQLPDHLAVELMRNLPQDARASILSKMDPKRAARLTESLANPQ